MTTPIASTGPTAPWSLMAPPPNAAPTSTAPAPLLSRAEERDEAQRFAAALKRAAGQQQDSTDEETTFVTYDRPPRPENEWSTMVVSEDTAQEDFFGEDGFSLGDLIDILNPLQHLPFISTVYRELTGDEMSAGARLAGGILYGGPTGLRRHSSQ